jgi:hypothetical protein
MLSDMQHKPPAQFRIDVLLGVVALQWLLSRPLLHFDMGNSILTQGVTDARGWELQELSWHVCWCGSQGGADVCWCGSQGGADAVLQYDCSCP